MRLTLVKRMNKCNGSGDTADVIEGLGGGVLYEPPLQHDTVGVDVGVD